MSKINVIMPQMGESIAEGTLSRWIKKAGDTVQRDEPIFEISTDKVDAKIPSPTAGVLAEILVNEGETVAVQTVVARIETDAAAAASAPTPTPAPAPKVATPAPAPAPPPPPPPPPPQASAPKSSPAPAPAPAREPEPQLARPAADATGDKGVANRSRSGCAGARPRSSGKWRRSTISTSLPSPAPDWPAASPRTTS